MNCMKLSDGLYSVTDELADLSKSVVSLKSGALDTLTSTAYIPLGYV